MRYAYPFHIEGNDEDGMGYNVVFPDVYGANTGGFTYEEARSNVEDCLVCALGAYVQMGWDLPRPQHPNGRPGTGRRTTDGGSKTVHIYGYAAARPDPGIPG